jgi:HEAT repeat protein
MRRSLIVVAAILFWANTATAQEPAPGRDDGDRLVQQLRDLAPLLPGIAPSSGVLPITEQRRQALYAQLRAAGANALPALLRGLRDPDVRLRRNVALAFLVLSGGYFAPASEKVDIRVALPGLVAAVRDPDASVRAWAAQAIGAIGPDALSAVPDLILLLSNADEGSRNSACIALRAIGPSAREALPALREALSDSSTDVRGFAQRAIASIDR